MESIIIITCVQNYIHIQMLEPIHTRNYWSGMLLILLTINITNSCNSLHFLLTVLKAFHVHISVFSHKSWEVNSVDAIIHRRGN